MADVLAIVAHPDDESFSMGGTLAQHVRDGDKVSVLVLSDGVGSRFGELSEQCAPHHHQRAAERRAGHFKAACAALGVSGAIIERFPDQQSDGVSQLSLNRFVSTYVELSRPTIAYTHSPGDVNIDHRRTAEAVLVATRGICPVYGCEPEWPTRMIRPFNLRHYVDISQTIDVKLQACRVYEDELRTHPHPRSLEKLTIRARMHGCLETPYMEAFEVYE